MVNRVLKIRKKTKEKDVFIVDVEEKDVEIVEEKLKKIISDLEPDVVLKEFTKPLSNSSKIL